MVRDNYLATVGNGLINDGFGTIQRDERLVYFLLRVAYNEAGIVVVFLVGSFRDMR
jgi:hypothetical protein